MTYEKPEVLSLGDATELIQGSSKPNVSDGDGTGILASTEVDE